MDMDLMAGVALGFSVLSRLFRVRDRRAVI